MANKYNAGYYDDGSYAIGEIDNGKIMGPAFVITKDLKQFQIGEYQDGLKHGWICINNSFNDNDYISIDKWEEGKHIASTAILSGKKLTLLTQADGNGKNVQYSMSIYADGSWTVNNVDANTQKTKSIYYSSTKKAMYMQILNKDNKAIKTVQIGKNTLRYNFSIPYSYFDDKVYPKPGDFIHADDIIYSKNDGPAFMWNDEDNRVTFGNMVNEKEHGIIVVQTDSSIRFTQMNNGLNDGPELFISSGQDNSGILKFNKKGNESPLEIYYNFEEEDDGYVSVSYYTDEDTYDSIEIFGNSDVKYTEDNHDESDDTGPTTEFSFESKVFDDKDDEEEPEEEKETKGSLFSRLKRRRKK